MNIVEKARQEGRVEGAIAELKATLITLNEMEAMHFSVKWWKKQIELRLKELEKGGKK